MLRQALDYKSKANTVFKLSLLFSGSQSWGVNRARFDFNTSDLRRNDTVMAAEFILTARRGFPSQPVNVTILVRRESDNQTAFEPLGWQIFHWVPRRLLIFDVKQAVEYWRVAQKARGELKVRMKKVGASWQAGSTHAKSAFRRGPTKGPFLVVYLRSPGENGTSPSLVELVKKQSVLLPETIPIMYNTKYVSQKLSPNMPVKVRGRPRAGYNRFLPSCRKSSLSLVLTRFFIWLIEPSTPIKVGMCYGLCFAPIDSSLMPTRHAVIMADLLKSRGIREPSRPHCVPLELTGLTVLFLDEETRTTKVQVWDNSVVKKCGCR